MKICFVLCFVIKIIIIQCVPGHNLQRGQVDYHFFVQQPYFISFDIISLFMKLAQMDLVKFV